MQEADERRAAAAFLLRGRAVRIWRAASTEQAGAPLRCGGAGADPAQGRRQGENRPARCDDAGADAASRAVDSGVGAGRGARGDAGSGAAAGPSDARFAQDAPAAAEFLLRHSLVSPYGHWTKMHRRWLGELIFAHPAQHLAHDEMLQRIERAEALCDGLKRAILELVPQWSLAPVVQAIQALRGVSLIVASVIVAEVGCFSRFDSPRQLMAYLGLNPSEHSSGAMIRRGAITKTGNALARTCLVEAAWTYRFPARVSQIIRDRLNGLPEPIRNVAWKAQVRLSARYRKLIAAGKPAPKVVVAIARELVGFIWAIARMVEPKFA